MIGHKDLHAFVKNIFLKIGCPEDDAVLGADVLIAAELRGINSHGVLRLPNYVALWEAKRINANPNIKIVHETPSTAVVDGDSGLGLVVAPKAMEIAIEKAKTAGTGWVAVKNSNHYGIAGYHAMKALEHDMIGMAMTNANSLVAPTFSKDRLLGTNPIAVTVPAKEEPPFVADFATTVIARGKLEVLHKKGEPAPEGFVQDKNGKPSTDPNILTEGGAILPLGGDRLHSSHKGYCLGAIVDIFSALLPGANFGPFVPPSVPYLDVPKNQPGEGTGHFFGAMRIDAFMPADEFKSKMDLWIKTMRSAKPIDGEEKVLIPGDPERESEKIKEKEGIPVLDKVYQNLKNLAEKYKVELPVNQ